MTDFAQMVVHKQQVTTMLTQQAFFFNISLKLTLLLWLIKLSAVISNSYHRLSLRLSHCSIELLGGVVVRELVQ